jgi:UDP-N-acetylglucosamine 2-epimerase
LVYGDTNSTLAGALATAYNHILFGHVEAGLRSYQKEMPEETNRIVADHLADFLFCPTPNKVRILKSEKARGHTVWTGDLMLDAALRFLPLARQNGLDPNLPVTKGEYVYVTLHRAENVDTRARLEKVVRILEGLKEPVVFPIHPRTRARLKKFGFWERVKKRRNILLIEPVGFLQSLALLDGARYCLTDSGGLQREAFFFDRPCLILRSTTEWPEILKGNFSRLVDLNPAEVMKWISREKGKRSYPLRLFGGGRAAENIVRFISSI